MVEVDDLFINTYPVVREIYKALLNRCKNFADISIDTTKSCIYFVDEHRFMALKPKKTGMILEFVLNREMDVFPVIKVIEIGKFRYAHRLVLDDPGDITEEVITWIKDALELCKGRL